MDHPTKFSYHHTLTKKFTSLSSVMLTSANLEESIQGGDDIEEDEGEEEE
jgi:hypothetical protein